MFDSAVCSAMSLGVPQLPLSALIELRELIKGVDRIETGDGRSQDDAESKHQKPPTGCADGQYAQGTTGRCEEGAMSPKITPEHLARVAVIYVRQSTMHQVLEHTESQRRQYALEKSARAMGFVEIKIIDDDLGRSGSGLVKRPGFEQLVASVCSGNVGTMFCIEASRLARNGRHWHHLIDLCALVGTLVIDPEGVYEPRLNNDRLLLGLKGTMSEYELNLLRQRGLAARESKAQRRELRFGLPPGYGVGMSLERSRLIRISVSSMQSFWCFAMLTRVPVTVVSRKPSWVAQHPT